MIKYCAILNLMEIFIKENNTPFKDFLLKEKDGLEVLSKALEDNKYLFIPKLLNASEHSLEIERIDSTYATVKPSKQLGTGLATLHQKIYESYEYEKDNYIGLNPQRNILTKNWGEFFINERLLFQIDLITNISIQQNFKTILENNYEKLKKFLNENCKHPSLVHGDLWSGNVLYSQDKVYLIDPAIYYGDREVDIAMTEMFGGFAKEFYDSYNETYPLSTVYEKKKTIYNLYHYVNHYNLFGNGYLSECEYGFEFIKERL